MRLVIGSDHAGKTLRLIVLKYLHDNNYEVLDVGTEKGDSVDYPHYAERVAAKVAAGEADLGILVCGTGIGMSMAANRVPGVRAALCANEFMASMSRAHNQANVLCLGERIMGDGLALSIVQAFLNGRFEGGRHARRVEQLTDLEKKRT
jgi:ribose 5-phosphate isomerase B